MAKVKRQMALILGVIVVIGAAPAATRGESGISQEPAMINLRASTTQPYVGQLVELHVDIDLPASTNSQPLRLSIPWLMREFGFAWQMPPDEWLCQHSLATAGLPVQINAWPQTIYLPPSGAKSNHYELSWWLLVQEPDVLTSGRIEFAPVRVEYGGGSVASKPLRLQVRRLPLPPADLPALNLNLGVGNYRLEATLEPSTVTVGEPAVLTLKISGEGALAKLPRPRLTALPFFKQTGDFFLEDSTESWNEAKTRSFRYQLRPRRFGTVTMPSLFYTCFDPALGKYQTRVVPGTALNVVAATNKSAVAAARPVAGALPERLRLTSYDDPDLLISQSSESPTFNLDIAIVSGFPLVTFLMAAIAAWHSRKSETRDQRKSAGAARHALHQLQKLDGDVSQVANVVMDFLSRSSSVRIEAPESRDIDNALRAMDTSPDRADAVRQFFRECDAVRFAPGGSDAAASLRALAENLVRTLSADK